MNEDEWAALRGRMVTEQLAGRDITDARVMDALRRVPRHRFVPPGLAAAAYEDRPLALELGQTISQPYIVALMAQTARVGPEHRALDVGTGSGYAAAVLAELAGEVVSIERHPRLAERARGALSELGYGRVLVVVGDGSEGYAPRAPYDRILVAAAAPGVPAALVGQLAPNGRLVIPVGRGREQTLTLVTKDAEGRATFSEGGPCAFVPLVGEQGFPGERTGGTGGGA